MIHFPAHFGQWGPVEMCPNGEFVVSFELKIMAPIGNAGDDTATAGIRLHCSSGSTITSSVDNTAGVWYSQSQTCADGFTGARVQVEICFEENVSLILHEIS